MDVQNSLAQLRAKRGLGAAQLATEVGVSRQTIYAIEAGTYVPNTTISLKLARILETTVEKIFQLEPEVQVTDDTAEAVVWGNTETMPPGQPLRLCSVNGNLVAVAPELGRWGLPPTDAVLLAPIPGRKRNSNAKVRIFGNDWKNPARILIAGCDPSASILENSLQRQGCELIIAYENSSRALELLHEGLVHIAGTHLIDKDTGKTDLLPITKLFPRKSVAVISYAIWQEGLVVIKGNPKKIAGITDIARKDVKITNRELGAGCRRLLDDLMKQHGIAVSQVKGYDRITLGHLPAARLVQSGEVDCCISTQAGARALGLDFIPLAQKPYHLVLNRKQLELPPVQTLIETLGRASFRREVEASVGYDMHTAGDRLV
ncbi:MAG: substrate-binding domain-containing protein [Candidatus Korobacteraceae bacterium]|jgi:molybdate-binding protein/DNA-binding XRE family transcriptional regulator